MVFSTSTQAAISSNPESWSPDSAIADRDRAVPIFDPASSAEALPVTLHHELQTTIHLLLNLTDLLLQDAAADSPQIDYLQSLHQGTEQLLGLLDPSEQQPQTVNLHRLIKTLYSLLLPEALNQGRILRVELNQTLPEYLKLRPNRLRRLVLTLMSYAIGQGQGPILLRASLVQSQLILEIQTASSLVAETIEGQLALDLGRGLCHQLGGEFLAIAGGLQLSIPVEAELTTSGTGLVPTAAATIALQVSDLTVMPIPWRQQLYQAALEGRDRQLQALIDQIPASQPTLIAAIESLVEQCHLEVVLQLAEASLGESSPIEPMI
jgi:hypothetical protein